MIKAQRSLEGMMGQGDTLPCHFTMDHQRGYRWLLLCCLPYPKKLWQEVSKWETISQAQPKWRSFLIGLICSEQELLE